MGLISLPIPQTGQPNSTEDPKVATALTTIQTAVNGGLSAANLATISWQTLTNGTSIGNAGAPYLTPGVSVDLMGYAHLRGVLKATAPEPDSAPMVTLPVGARPLATVPVMVPIGTSITNATMQAVLIASNGQISTASGLGIVTNSLVLLDQIPPFPTF